MGSGGHGYAGVSTMPVGGHFGSDYAGGYPTSSPGYSFSTSHGVSSLGAGASTMPVGDHFVDGYAGGYSASSPGISVSTSHSVGSLGLGLVPANGWPFWQWLYGGGYTARRTCLIGATASTGPVIALGGYSSGVYGGGYSSVLHHMTEVVQ